MGYLYENSNPERFQHLCQSLLLNDMPSLQCYPIGQPDGGRDGWDPNSKTVLQVKFKRQDEDENAEWLIESLEKELPKIRKLIELGAEEYIIATNARGTAHLGVGRIDKVQKWLNDKLAIPARCFWRDEIDRRYDSATVSLKLKYAETLTLEDGVELLIGKMIGGDKKRQQDAIRAFIISQFNADKTVKFKQVNMTNELLDLFIDVPIELIQKYRKGNSTTATTASNGGDLLSALTSSERLASIEEDNTIKAALYRGSSGELEASTLGAAQVLLNDEVQAKIKLIVLEGAPGQGKSTLAQFVCQIHRARFLGKDEILEKVDPGYLQNGFRIPIKVDLRDYAAFLDGNSPFSTEGAESAPRSLDVFLAQMVAYSSGGIQFSAHDILGLFERAPILLFLDGLDEVADFGSRDSLVSSIGEALSRWHEFETDIQVIVTSRPSIFGSAPNFEKLGFSTFTLKDIDRSRIDDYVGRWVIARGLDDLEQKDVNKILAEKLELAHIRELTRNPMQLTILLSLIHQVGHSLPDQRTDLYSRYVDLFITREADKSVRVRENRPVLLGFIQHLAWILQTQAESSNSAGSISIEDLQELARDYLQNRGHNEGIADDLFGGGLERIFVLVERIEGLYEFEVQPLREFYCAQYLYTTAPVGTYRDKILRGDRAQRFEALATNPFWLNVCRFYAGFCERGEVGTLVLSLEEMIKVSDVAESVHARRVGLALLQDWVFSNSKWSQKKLIETVFDDYGLVCLVNDSSSSDALTLDPECGRSDLRDIAFNYLISSPMSVHADAICRLLSMNGGYELEASFLGRIDGTTGRERTREFMRMVRCGAVAGVSPEITYDLIWFDSPEEDELLTRCGEILDRHPALAYKIRPMIDYCRKSILDGRAPSFMTRGNPLALLSSIVRRPDIGMLGLAARQRHALRSRNINTELLSSDVKEFLSAVSEVGVNFRSRGQSSNPDAWNSVAEISRNYFGETWSAYSIAIRAAGFKFSAKESEKANTLFDLDTPVCFRARTARLRRRTAKWWLKQLDDSRSDLDRMFWAGMVLMWSDPESLFGLMETVAKIVSRLSKSEFDAIRATICESRYLNRLRADRAKMGELDVSLLPDRTAVLLAESFNFPVSRLRFKDDQIKFNLFGEYLADLRWQESVGNPPPWKRSDQALVWARRVAQGVNDSSRSMHYVVFRHLMRVDLTHSAAAKVLDRPLSYPREVTINALETLELNFRPQALDRVAIDDDWVFE